MGLSRDQEKAMFAGSGKSGKGIRKKQIVSNNKKIVNGIKFNKQEKTFDTDQLKKIVDGLDLKIYDYNVLVRKNWGAYVKVWRKDHDGVPAVPSYLIDKLVEKLKEKGFDYNKTYVFASDPTPKIELEFIKVE